MSSWATFRLDELGEFKNGANFSQADYGQGFPIVNVKQLYQGRFASIENLLELKASAVSNPEALFLRRGDILFARSSVKASGAGQVAMVGHCPPNAVYSGFIIRFRLSATNRAVPDFLNYLLRSPVYRELLTRIGTGTTITNLSQGALGRLTVELPSVDEQRAIVSILAALDDKIDFNHRMNRTLEAMARAIFTDWFINFEPVHSKMERRTPYLAPEIWNLFPEKIDNLKKPKGWDIEPLDQIADFLNGLALQKYPASGEPSLPVIKISQLRADKVANSDRASVDIPSQYIIENGDLLFSWSGSLLHRIWTAGRGALKQHLFKVTSKRFPKWFYFYWIDHHMESFRATAASKATTMGHIQRHHLSEALTVVPSPPVMAAADAIIAPLFDRVIANNLESRALALARDQILPNLISGEIRVKVVERIAGVAS